MKGIIIGVTGTLGAGKTTVAEYLVTKGFVHKSVRAFLADEVRRRNVEVTRDSLVDLGNELRKQFGAGYIIEEIVKSAAHEGGSTVIESIRAVGEARTLLDAGGILLSVDAPIKSRYERVIEGESQIVPVSFEQFQGQELREMHSSNEEKQSIADVMMLAQFHVLNTGSYDTLHTEVDKILSEIEKIQNL